MPPALKHLAALVFHIQEVVKARPVNNQADPVRVFGPAIAGQWTAIRAATGLNGGWHDLAAHEAAFEKTFAAAPSRPVVTVKPGGPQLAPGVAGLSALEFNLAEFDPASSMCSTCGYDGPRDASGTCGHCGGVG